MRYHPEQKKAFCHIPRTAGRSIYSNWDGCKDVLQTTGFSMHMHLLPSHYIEHNSFLKDYEWFTVTRNPYDRIISHWTFKLQVSGFTLEEIKASNIHLPTILYKGYKTGFNGSFRIRGIESSPKMSLSTFKVQTLYPIRIARECDLVFKYEQIDEVEDYLKIKLIKRVPKNPSFFNFDIFKTSEYISVINDIFKAEFQEFGYEELTP